MTNERNGGKLILEKMARSIVDLVESVYESVVKEDDEYKELEKEKNEIIGRLREKLSDEDFEEIQRLLDCLDGQNFITAMGFSFVRVLDLKKLYREDEKMSIFEG